MKIDMHVHTSETSPCAKATAIEMLELYNQKGYDAVFVTDHFNDYVLEAFPRKERIKRYLSGYEAALKYSAEFNIKVFFGIETCLVGGQEDFLIYGVTPDFVYQNPKLYNMRLEEVYDLVHALNGLLIQAHPNRGYCRQSDIRYLDGVELHNGNPRHNSHNDITQAFCKKYPRLITTSGSDFHESGDEGRGGMIMDANNEFEIINCMKEKSYRLIV